MKRKKIIISCGGTGGHIFPAIEIAKSLKLKNPNIDILFVGALSKMEMVKIPKEGFPILGIWIQGIDRKSIFKNLLFPIKLCISLIQSLFVLIYHSPIAIIGTGGFASGPVLFMGALLGYKTYIQEQNCFAGLTNKLLSKRVNKIFVAHNEMEKFFPKHKIFNLGNPVRHSLKKTNEITFINDSRKFFGLSKDCFTILIIGGSLGAEPINRAIANSLKDLTSRNCQLIWQTGKSQYLKYSHLKSPTCSIQKFIDRMDVAYAASDIVISRAGAIAIAEICFLSKASILIPSSYVTDNHQTVNAQYLKKHNTCIMIKEIELEKKLIESIDYLKEKNRREEMGRLANKLFNYNAARDIASIVLKDITG